LSQRNTSTVANKLFRSKAGVRNLIQSLAGFLAFELLPRWANAFDDEEKGTSFALWMCAVLSVVSLSTSAIVYFSMKKDDLNSSAEEHSDQKTISNAVRMFAKATAPKIPRCQRCLMPLSFFCMLWNQGAIFCSLWFHCLFQQNLRGKVWTNQ
jgi:Na+/melibiose symporter-like transporter